MAPALKASERTRALAALKQAESFIQGTRENVDGDALTLIEVLRDEGRRMQQASTSLVLALIKDTHCPAALFKPWASVRKIRDWRDDGKLKDVVIRNGKVSVKPSAFFAHWNTLTDESK